MCIIVCEYKYVRVSVCVSISVCWYQYVCVSVCEVSVYVVITVYHVVYQCGGISVCISVWVEVRVFMYVWYQCVWIR